MSATSRRTGPAGAHTEAIVLWSVLLVVLLAGGLLTASLHLAVRLSGSGEQLPAHPVTLLSDLVRADQGAHTGPDPVDRIAEHGAGRSADSRPPEQPVANPAGAASSASVRISHDLVSIAALGEVPP